MQYLKDEPKEFMLQLTLTAVVTIEMALQNRIAYLEATTGAPNRETELMLARTLLEGCSGSINAYYDGYVTGCKSPSETLN